MVPLSISISIVLLLVYGLFLTFSLGTHSALFKGSHGHDEGHAEPWSVGKAALVLAGSTAAMPQTAIVRAWHAPAWRDADVQRLQLFAEVLSGSRSARLDRRLVDEEALCEAHDVGHLMGAALDVFKTEPLPLDTPLLKYDNVVLEEDKTPFGVPARK